MMTTLLAATGIVLPWLAGAACLLVLLAPARDRAPWALALGYGWPAGAVLLALWLNLLSLLGLPFSFALAAAGPLFLFAVAGLVYWRQGRQPRAMATPRPVGVEWRAQSAGARVLWCLMLLMIAARGVQLLLEIVWRPIFGWDAWAHWATKAKVWFSAGKILPFGSAGEFLAGTAAYMDANPHYPSGIPLVQTWMALCLGRWDDSLVNLPWLAWAAALAIALYARLREAGGGPLLAMFATYLLLSLPMLETHVALPGYADLPLAVSVALAFMAFSRWSITRSRRELVLAAAFAAALPLLKNPGWVWFGLFAPAALVALQPRLGLRLVAAGAAGAVLVLLVLAQIHPQLMGYQLHTTFQPVWGALATTTLLFGNWHLLWYLAPFMLAISWRQLLDAKYAPLVTYLAGGCFFLFVVFFFSNAAIWVTDFSTVNRALLHIAPSLLFLLALLALDRRERLAAAPLPEPAPAAHTVAE